MNQAGRLLEVLTTLELVQSHLDNEYWVDVRDCSICERRIPDAVELVQEVLNA